MFYANQVGNSLMSVRELRRQIALKAFERTNIADAQIIEPTRIPFNTFKDPYILDLFGLQNTFLEKDLEDAILHDLETFILELGKDFLFIGEEYKLQVGNSDFYIDLLFYHRGLQCLVAFELKADKFKPDHLGQLNFYLEAFDRDVKKPNENPSIGVLLCKDKDSEVV